MIEQLDSIVRLFAIGASSLLLLLLLAGKVRTPIKVTLVGLLLGVAGYLLNSSNMIERGDALKPFLDLFAIFTPFWMWMFARHLFERDPPNRLLWPVIAALVASWFASHFLPTTGEAGFYVIHLVSLALIVDLVRVALADRADDLVEKRRAIRIVFPLLVAAQAGGVLLFELAVGSAIPYPPVQLANAILIFALTLFAGLTLLKTDSELLVETERRVPPEETAQQLSPSERVLKDRLEAAMEDGFYRTAGLTIAALAAHLDTPEHRLRALINQRLGYRNFAAFLNHHRIAEARAALADPDKVDLPVLTIAMDLGYNSLAPFNRAFRQETGTTPTEFRREAIDRK